MAKEDSKNYGKGDYEANPFYGGEATEFKGKAYTVISPHGTAFGEGFLPIRTTNIMEDVINENSQNGGAGMSKGSKKKKGKVNS